MKRRHPTKQGLATASMAAALAVCALGTASSARARGGRSWVPHTAASGTYGAVFPVSQAEPNPRLTPGALNPNVMQANISQTICRRGGYTRSVRPPETYTEALKRRQIAEYGYGDRRLRDYEEDHLVSLELGGAPSDPRNLWPEPHHVAGGWGSYAKGRLENRLHQMVCRSELSLAQAQSELAHHWIAAYKRYIGDSPIQDRQHRYGG